MPQGPPASRCRPPTPHRSDRILQRRSTLRALAEQFETAARKLKELPVARAVERKEAALKRHRRRRQMRRRRRPRAMASARRLVPRLPCTHMCTVIARARLTALTCRDRIALLRGQRRRPFSRCPICSRTRAPRFERGNLPPPRLSPLPRLPSVPNRRPPREPRPADPHPSKDDLRRVGASAEGTARSAAHPLAALRCGARCGERSISFNLERMGVSLSLLVQVGALAGRASHLIAQLALAHLFAPVPLERSQQLARRRLVAAARTDALIARLVDRVLLL